MTDNESQLKGNIFSIVRASLHDGGGVRTVIYFKGCPLRCEWCHNPESHSFENDIQYYPLKCIKCGRCAAVCPGCHKINGGDMVFERAGCKKCGGCAGVCPNGALILCGKSYSRDEIIKIALKDKIYYDKSNGGVTLSGGEFLAQTAFAAGLLKSFKKNDINTAAETSLYAGWKCIEEVLNHTDTFIVDIKHMDSNAHRSRTGVENDLILNNVKKLSFLHKNIWIRIPMIRCFNDGDQNITDTVEFLNNCGDGIKRIELLKYNNLMENKYHSLGKKPVGFVSETQDDGFITDKNNLIKNHIKGNIEIINQYK